MNDRADLRAARLDGCRMRRLAVILLVLIVAVPALGVGLGPLAVLAAFRKEVPPPPRDLPVKTVNFRASDGVDLVAWYVEAEAPKATVILVHGASGTRGDPFVDLPGMMRDLVGRNYAVLALDLRNHGDSAAGPRPPQFGPDEAQDVIAAASWIKERDPTRRVAAYGISMGGNAVLYAAVADPRIEAVITQETFIQGAPVMRRGLQAETGYPDFVVDGLLWGARHLWGLGDGNGRAIEVVGQLGTRPYLIIHSRSDPIVPFADAEALAAADPAARLWATPAPDPADPRLLEAGAWGSHARSYVFYRELWIDTVGGFLDSVFATMFG